MKILAIYSDLVPVDLWRIQRPMRELAKHMPADWTIDHETHLIPPKETNDITEFELELLAKKLGQYDVVYLSYYALARTGYVLMKAVSARTGTQFVIDIDDNLFAVNEDNPIWMSTTHEEMHDLQTMIRDAPWLTTTTLQLAHVMRTRRPAHHANTTIITPNYISDDYQHPEIDHGDRVTIGYFGGSSHFSDLHDSGFPKAMRDIMRKYKHVDFRAAGVPLDIPMSPARESFLDPVRGQGWITDVFPKLDMDIVVAPLLDNAFNVSKSNIKWQEATRAGAAFIASNVGPYRQLKDAFTDFDGVAYIVARNTRHDWSLALEEAVVMVEKRRSVVRRAQAELAANWRLEDHWEMYADLFERVATGTRNMV